MTNYLRRYGNLTDTPVDEPIPGTDQIRNNDGGGFAWAVSDWTRLRRFLVLGAEGGTYYVKEHELVRQDAQAVERCIAADGRRTVAEIADISMSGRAPRNDPAIFALAMCLSLGNEETRQTAAMAINKVCRTGTHILHFAQYARQFRGTGPLFRRAISRWFLDRTAEDLVFQAIKYPSRNGWALRDLARLGHPKPGSALTEHELSQVLRWIVKQGDTGVDYDETGPLARLNAVRRLAAVSNPHDAAVLIERFDLPREAVPTRLLASKEVWEALLPGMPITAVIRNLATLTRNGTVKPTDFRLIEDLTTRITDPSRLRGGRVHPLSILVALKTYASGGVARGSWSTSTKTDPRYEPIQKLVDALDRAFYLAFQAVELTGRRILLACDVSGSMVGPDIAGMTGISPRVATAALALVTAAREPRTYIHAFSHTFVPLSISPSQRLDTVIKHMEDMSFGATDCSLPMEHAIEHQLDVDAFVVLTDSETNRGRRHPAQALRAYRKARNPAAQLIVVGMTSTGISIADPNDAGMLDVVGFDTATPDVMSSFIRRGV